MAVIAAKCSKWGKDMSLLVSLIGSIHPDNMGSDNPVQPRKATPLLAFLGSGHYLRGPVGKPSGRSIDAMESAIVRETFRSVCSHSDTVALVFADVESVGS